VGTVPGHRAIRRNGPHPGTPPGPAARGTRTADRGPVIREDGPYSPIVGWLAMFTFTMCAAGFAAVLALVVPSAAVRADDKLELSVGDVTPRLRPATTGTGAGNPMRTSARSESSTRGSRGGGTPCGG